MESSRFNTPIDHQIYEEGILETQKFFKCDREQAIKIHDQITTNIENYLKTEYDEK
jgi:hypothetical protein